MHLDPNYLFLVQIIFSDKFEILQKVETSDENDVKSLCSYNNECRVLSNTSIHDSVLSINTLHWQAVS